MNSFLIYVGMLFLSLAVYAGSNNIADAIKESNFSHSATSCPPPPPPPPNNSSSH